jgi:hypothetical protein
MSDIKVILIAILAYCLLVWFRYILSLSPLFDRFTTHRRSRAGDELHDGADKE